MNSAVGAITNPIAVWRYAGNTLLGRGCDQRFLLAGLQVLEPDVLVA
jgi:hypothetical protein